MADTLTLNVSDDFSLDALASQLSDNFKGQGFETTVVSLSPTSTRVTFDKGCGGINMLLGMGQGITANMTLNGNLLYVNYADGDWTGKIIGLATGWILCWVPFITAIIGSFNQLNLPKKINTEITMILPKIQNENTEQKNV